MISLRNLSTESEILLINQSFPANDLYFVISILSTSTMLIGVGTGFSDFGVGTDTWSFGLGTVPLSLGMCTVCFGLGSGYSLFIACSRYRFFDLGVGTGSKANRSSNFCFAMLW